VMAVEDQFPFLAPRQIELCREYISRIVVAASILPFALPGILVSFRRVIVTAAGGRAPTELGPLHVRLASIVLAIARVELVEHRLRLLAPRPHHGGRTIGL